MSATNPEPGDIFNIGPCKVLLCLHEGKLCNIILTDECSDAYSFGKLQDELLILHCIPSQFIGNMRLFSNMLKDL